MPSPSPVVEASKWVLQPKADQFVKETLEAFLKRCPGAARLKERMLNETGIRMLDILDHMVLPAAVGLEDRLRDAGFITKQLSGADLCYVHEDGLFPDIVIRPKGSIQIFMAVEFVADFLAAHNLSVEVEGKPWSPYRRAKVWEGDRAEFWIVERHGHVGFDVPNPTDEQIVQSLRHLEVFRSRRRLFTDEIKGFDSLDALIDRAIEDLGVHWTCFLFFLVEREYWQRRNKAAQVQKARQDVLGLGWVNDDHHTFDTSRPLFTRTIRTLEKLGFYCRERFYAGSEAGWGSQILEQPALGIIIFADLDLTPEELEGDYAHLPKEPLKDLRRAGMWCALHGESLLEAGINHLECMYDSKALHQQLQNIGIEWMKPFSDFPHLYQELTLGERWPVREERLQRLLAQGYITKEDAEDFRKNGAIGSHLENLERNQGFKGFNQPGISGVILRIDPRANMGGQWTR